MKDLDSIQLRSSAQLGSLEDSAHVKRLTATQIRKLRSQAQQQETLRFSFVRAARKTWSDLVEQIGILLSQRHETYCSQNGHSMFWHSGTYICRYCGLESATSEHVVSH
ncbi:MAG TPA: hypothetical protein V6C81_16710 [Planktothrix sp.]